MEANPNMQPMPGGRAEAMPGGRRAEPMPARGRVDFGARDIWQGRPIVLLGDQSEPEASADDCDACDCTPDVCQNHLDIVGEASKASQAQLGAGSTFFFEALLSNSYSSC